MADGRVFLALPPADESFQIFLREPWAKEWDEVLPQSFDAQALDLWAAEHLGAFLRLSPSMTVPVAVGASLGLILTELDQLRDAQAEADAWSFIVFQPSRLAVLDVLRQTRQTLVAARALPVGHVMGAEDMESRFGGGGLDSSLQDQVFGCRLQYPLQAGEDVTFGFLQWTGPQP